MKEMDIGDFLNQFTDEELGERSVLRGDTRMLTNLSVMPLIELMAEQEVTRVEDSENDWFLTSSGEFNNPSSKKAQSGNIEDTASHAHVFTGQNASNNPHYTHYKPR